MKLERNQLVQVSNGQVGRVLAERGGPDYYTVLIDGVETGPWYQGDLALLSEQEPAAAPTAPPDGGPAEVLDQIPEMGESGEGPLQSDDVMLPDVADDQDAQFGAEGAPA